MSSIVWVVCPTLVVLAALVVADRAMRRGRSYVAALATVVTALAALVSAFAAFVPPA